MASFFRAQPPSSAARQGGVTLRPARQGGGYIQVGTWHQSAGFVFSNPVNDRQAAAEHNGLASFFRAQSPSNPAHPGRALHYEVLESIEFRHTAVGHSFSRKLSQVCASKRRTGFSPRRVCATFVRPALQAAAGFRPALGPAQTPAGSRRQSESHTPRRAWEVN